jgi:biotin transport system substrate-specific component
MLLGAKYGALSQLAYVLLGAAGAPVFAMFRGGPAVLAGPTGGYIAGYVIAAWVIGLITGRPGGKMLFLAAACAAGFVTYMVMGTCWFMVSTNTYLHEALMICVVPFLPGDALKIAVASGVAFRLRPALAAKIGG